jgi:hypothetical protein
MKRAFAELTPDKDVTPTVPIAERTFRAEVLRACAQAGLPLNAIRPGRKLHALISSAGFRLPGADTMRQYYAPRSVRC